MHSKQFYFELFQLLCAMGAVGVLVASPLLWKKSKRILALVFPSLFN